MTAKKNTQEYALVVINNVTSLTTKQVEDYCKTYDKNIRCVRRQNLNVHPYIHAVFSSCITANNFLADRPHFIRNCRINASLINDPQCGPRFVYVQVGEYSSITENSLFEYTSKKFGRVLNCIMFKSRGFAFIEFHRLEDANRALTSWKQQFNGYTIQYLPRKTSSKILPFLPLTRLIHIGNFSNKDQEILQLYFRDLISFTIHKNCYGQMYILGSFNISDSIQLLLRRALCLNGRVLSIFIDEDDTYTGCDNYLLVRNVSFRLNDYNLLEYFSQYGRVLNCYRYGQTDSYRIQYRDKESLNKVLESNRIHVIKSVRMQVEREQN